MFTHNISPTKHFTSLLDGVEAYNNFLVKLKLSRHEFPFEWKGEAMHRNKPILFRVTSWGSYITASNEWRIFISWRAHNGGMTKFISWSWDKEKQETTEQKINQFLP